MTQESHRITNNCLACCTTYKSTESIRYMDCLIQSIADWTRMGTLLKAGSNIYQ